MVEIRIKEKVNIRKTFTIITEILVAIAILLVGYYYLFSDSRPTPVQQAIPQYTLVHLVRNVSTQDLVFSESISTAPGDIVEFLIKIENVRSTIENVNVINEFPAELRLVSESITLNGVVVPEDDLVNPQHGLILGNLLEGSEKEIKFRAVTKKEGFFLITTAVNIVQVTSNNVPRKEAAAEVKIGRRI